MSPWGAFYSARQLLTAAAAFMLQRVAIALAKPATCIAYVFWSPGRLTYQGHKRCNLWASAQCRASSLHSRLLGVPKVVIAAQSHAPQLADLPLASRWVERQRNTRDPHTHTHLQVGDYPAAHLFNTTTWFSGVPAVVVAAPQDATQANRSAWVMMLSTPVYTASAMPTLTLLANAVTPESPDEAAYVREGSLADTYLNNSTAGVSAVGAWPAFGAAPLFLSNITVFIEARRHAIF